MIASVHPMLFRERYREVFAQKCLAPDEPTLKNWSNTQDFPESCVEFHKLSNEYKLVENGVRSKDIQAKYGRAYGSTG
jgi:hypothetical protein